MKLVYQILSGTIDYDARLSVIRVMYQVSKQVRARLITISLTVNWCNEPNTNSNTPKTAITSDTKKLLLTPMSWQTREIDRYKTRNMYRNGRTSNNSGNSSGLVFMKKIKPNRYSSPSIKTCLRCFLTPLLTVLAITCIVHKKKPDGKSAHTIYYFCSAYRPGYD